MKKTKQDARENGAGNERRRSTRFQIRGSAWFQWETEDGQSRDGIGVTHDISKAGTFIETPAIPQVGARLKVVVTISSGEKEDMQVRLCGAGDVRHVQDEREVDSGFGAWVGFHTEGAASG
jgi:hypothetical protein